ncbi:MAG: DUF4412 domain-containing protein [Candidatus Aminicenantia bacterium]
MKVKNRLLILVGLCLISLTILFTPVIQADLYIQGKRHTEAFTIMGQTNPEKDETLITWMSKDKYRNDSGQESSFIVRLDKNKIYHLDHTKKSYSMIDLPVDLSKILPPQAQQMMQMFKMTAAVTDTGETKKIKDWNCRKYLVDLKGAMMSMNMEIWATKDLELDYETYQKFSDSVMSLNPMFKDIFDEIKKIDGYRVLSFSTVSIMGTSYKVSEEIIDVQEKSAPSGTYDIPEGYTQVEFNPMERKG